MSIKSEDNQEIETYNEPKMSQCFNPDCLYQNPADNNFCDKCGSKLLLTERYRGICYLGEGRFGKTFKAIDEHQWDIPCVIKQFLPLKQGNAEHKRGFELLKKETMYLKNLAQHPQIPDLLAFFEQDGKLYLVQEFIDGHDLLKELEQRKRFSEQEVQQVLIDILSVLDFVHSHQVVHGDIKPENIIRKKNGSLVLINFGIAEEVSASVIKKIGIFMGNPSYG
ncbi:MAG: protein kinase, partial [Moorea sp. SIO2B7]|nr:protein kinase [Moorena sp. SIO2B7]